MAQVSVATHQYNYFYRYFLTTSASSDSGDGYSDRITDSSLSHVNADVGAP